MIHCQKLFCSAITLIASLMAVTAHAADPRYLALGDSYTIGQGVAPADRWPAQLVKLLHAQSLHEENKLLADPEYIAQTGWTSAELLAAMTQRSPIGPYALVTVQIGVNDQFRERDIANFRDDLRELLLRAKVLTGGDAHRVVVLSIPDWSLTPFGQHSGRSGISTAIDDYNNICRTETETAGCAWVDITAGTRAKAADPNLIGADGLHPSALLYAQWALTARDAVNASLSENSR